MFDPYAIFRGPVPQPLAELLAIEKKSDLKKYCASLVIKQTDFVRLVVNCERIGYTHEIKHKDWAPEHLNPTADELQAIHVDVDGRATGDTATLLRKITQIFRDRRFLVAHLFANSGRWHLFYFDQRDLHGASANHWTGGSHVHFVNDLWPEYAAGQLWTAFDDPKASAAGKLHIRFDEDVTSRGGTGRAG